MLTEGCTVFVRLCAVLLFGLVTLGIPLEAYCADEKVHSDNAGHGHSDLGHANASPSMEDAAEFKSDLAIWSFVVFLLLFGILYKFAWGPIAAGLDQREKSIADNIAAGERAREEASQMIAQYEAKLAGAADEVRLLLEEARRDAEHTKQEILDEAKKDAKGERDRALREIDMATDQALKRLAESSANMAVDLAGKIIHQQLKPADHRDLIKEAVDNFPGVSPSVN